MSEQSDSNSQLGLGSSSKPRTKRADNQAASTIAPDAQQIISSELPQDRRSEILEYLQLFGYKPDTTIIQIHVAGFFNKKGVSKRKVEKRLADAKRYGGTTFVVVGRSHDPSILQNLIKPKTGHYEASPGYAGYLWKNKDPYKRAPHELLPLDFTPAQFAYPDEWRKMFATRGFMVAMHVPASFARNKNKLMRALYRAAKTCSVKDKWTFLADVKSFGYGYQQTWSEYAGASAA